MKGTKASELREKSVEELSRLVAEKEENLFNLRIRHAAKTLESSAELTASRRDLARVKTILGEKQRAAAQG